MNEIFGIDKFNVISDNENYYVFRALNTADNNDIENEITTNGEEIERIRTDRERWEEKNGKAKYSEDSEISLEEVWNHIKMRYSKETNCISLSTNSNVSIDYGKSYNENYVMIKVPKTGQDNVVFAGQYMLDEISKIIDEEISKLEKNSEVHKLIENIDKKDQALDIKGIVSDVFKRAKSEGKYIGTNIKLDKKISIADRFSKKQYFSDAQQIAYNKIIAKLTVLEMYGKLKSILKTTPDNASLIATIGNAFSSGELVHYKDINKSEDEFTVISKEMMDILSLVQQAKDSDRNNEKIRKLEDKVLEYINSGKQIEEISTEKSKNEALTISEIYELTEGKVPYKKATETIEFMQNLINSRKKALNYAEKLREIVNYDVELEEVIQKIENTGFVIDNKIVARANNYGYKIAESVNIGIRENHRIDISDDEQSRIINYVKGLDSDKLSNMTFDNIKEYIMQNVDSNTKVTENRYYAETIVDSLDMSKIYKNALAERYLSKEERERILTQLEKADCKRLYDSFIKAGIKPNEVCNYIINILANKGYQNHSIEELSRLENLDEIINTNVNNTFLKGKVYALTMDELLDIKDNENKVDDTDIVLRDYQQQAIDNAEEIYSQGKRFAGVVLPTGAGKSFVAMTEMLKNKNGNILYFAPQTEILNQIQRHILKHVVGMEVLTPEEIDNLEKKRIKKAPEGKIFPNEVKEYISKYFPHLKMYCYQGMSDKEQNELKENLKNADANLIVFDELHRTGAETWEPIVKELIEKNKNSKILGITATPIRDTDHRDMMRELAIATGTYTKEEITQKKYLASEMYLVDAIQQGLVVEPKIVSFNYTLKETDEYLEVQKMIEEEKDENKKKQLQAILDGMNEIINAPDELMQKILEESNPIKKDELKKEYEMLMNSLSKQEKNGIGKVIQNNISKKDGRYIVFLPYNTTDLPTEEYMQKEIEKVKLMLKDIDSEPETGMLSSKNSKEENHRAISNFEDSKSEHLKLLFAIDMLNEGVHVDDINGEIMLRKISGETKILYLQQLGRVIYSLEPGKDIPNEDIPIVYDIYNNYLLQNMNKEINKRNVTSDLQRTKDTVNWVNKHGYIPDINSEIQEEAKKAIFLKKIQAKYEKYLDKIEGKRLSETDIYEIEQILTLGKSIDLFNLVFPERIIPPGEKDLGKVSLFKVTGTQKRFLELFQDASSITRTTRKQSDNLRLREVMSVLESLEEYDIEISNETIALDSKLSDILENVPEHIRQILLEELTVPQDYNIGEEYNFAKLSFVKENSYFAEADVKELYRYGIFEAIPKQYLNAINTDKTVDKDLEILDRDFIINGPKKLKNLNVKTGTYYDENGFNYNGMDEFELGQQRLEKLVEVISLIYKYSESNIFINIKHKINAKTELENMLYRKGVKGKGKIIAKIPNNYDIYNEIMEVRNHLEKTKPDLDKKTIILYKQMGIIPLNLDENKIDKETQLSENTLIGILDSGFDKNQYYWEEDENGRLTRGSIHNREGFNAKNLYIGMYHYSDKGYDAFGNSVKLDEHGFDDKDGYYWEKNESGELKRIGKRDKRDFSKDGIWYSKRENREKGKINAHHFDIDGFYWRLNEKTGEYERTESKLDEHNFDIDGYYWEENEKGEWYNSGRKLNRKNFNIDGIYYIADKNLRQYKSTGSYYGPDGYNINGLDRNKYDRTGLCKEAIKKYIKSIEYDERGFNKETRSYRDSLSSYSFEDGYNIDGYDSNGYDIDGNLNPKLSEYNEHGLDRHNFSKAGYFFERDQNGKMKSTKQKFDNHGFMKDGKTKDGSIFNDRGFTIYGVHRNRTKFDDDGYDIDGFDKNGFDKNGIHKETKQEYDRNGFYKNGIHKDTGLKYDKHKFSIDGINVITKSYSDVLGFTIDGRNIYNNGKNVNIKGFDFDRNYIDKYHQKHKYREGKLNAFGYDKDGKDEKGTIHPNIRFTKYYLQRILLKGNSREKICDELAQEYEVSEADMQSYINIAVTSTYEGFPPIKELLSSYVHKVEEAIEQKNQEIEKLLQDKSAKLEEIEKKKRISENLKKRIDTAKDIYDVNEK